MFFRIVLAGLVLACVSAWTVANARPAHCPPRNWCGCYLAAHLGKNDRSLWLARNWAKVGRPAGGPAVGTIVVWRHHVGIIVGGSPGRWVVLSGNDGRQVRRRVRPVNGAIAFRWP